MVCRKSARSGVDGSPAAAAGATELLRKTLCTFGWGVSTLWDRRTETPSQLWVHCPQGIISQQRYTTESPAELHCRISRRAALQDLHQSHAAGLPPTCPIGLDPGVPRGPSFNRRCQADPMRVTCRVHRQKLCASSSLAVVTFCREVGSLKHGLPHENPASPHTRLNF